MNKTTFKELFIEFIRKHPILPEDIADGHYSFRCNIRVKGEGMKGAINVYGAELFLLAEIKK